MVKFIDDWMHQFVFCGHDPQLDEKDSDGIRRPNLFALDDDPHNGPLCIRCGYFACMHCTEMSDIPLCTGVWGESGTDAA